MKNHWLKNPNKNYLGNWDLPDGKDVVLTIDTANWEAVKNPILNTVQEKRIIRFMEKDKWIKPFIVNETNAKAILKCTGVKYMEDSTNLKIKIGISQTKVKREEVDCLRVRNVCQQELTSLNISKEQKLEILALLPKSEKTEKEICDAMEIKTISDLPIIKFKSVKNRLEQLILKKGVKNEAS